MKHKRDTLLLLSAAALRSTAGLALAFALTRVLSTASYGQFRGAQILATLSVAFLVVALPQSLLYLYPTSEPAGQRRLALQTFVQLVVLGALMAVGLLLFSSPIASRFSALETRLFVICAAALALGQSLSLSAPTIAVARGDLRGSARYEIVLGLAPLLAAVVPALLGATAVSCLLILATTHLILGLAFWSRLVPSWREKWLDGPLLRRQWSLAGPQSLNSMLGSVAHQADKFIVAALFRPELFAIYVCGAFEVPLVTLLPFIMTKSIAPRLARAFDDRRTQDFLNVWHKAIRLGSLALFPCALVLWILAETIIGLLFPSEYAAAVYPFRVFLLLIPLRFTGYGLVLQSTGTTRPMLTAAGSGLAANLVLAWLMIPSLGPTGAAWAAVCGQVVSVVLHLRAIRIRLGVNVGALLPFRNLAVLSCCASAAGGAAYGIGLVLPDPGGAFASAATVGIVFYALAFLTKTLSAADVSFLIPRRMARGPEVRHPA